MFFHPISTSQLNSRGFVPFVEMKHNYYRSEISCELEYTVSLRNMHVTQTPINLQNIYPSIHSVRIYAYCHPPKHGRI